MTAAEAFVLPLIVFALAEGGGQFWEWGDSWSGDRYRRQQILVRGSLRSGLETRSPRGHRQILPQHGAKSAADPGASPASRAPQSVQCRTGDVVTCVAKTREVVVSTSRMSHPVCFPTLEDEK